MFRLNVRNAPVVQIVIKSAISNSELEFFKELLVFLDVECVVDIHAHVESNHECVFHQVHQRRFVCDVVKGISNFQSFVLNVF